MNRLTDFFERVMVISLPSRTDRRKRLCRHLRDIGLANGIEWIDAVPGDVERLPDGWSAGPGAWGCLQSQLKALRQALADRAESVLILEDDVVFSRHTLDYLPLIMSALPDDWGQFYLGGQHLVDPSRTESPVLWRGNNVNRTHAWAAHARSLPEIIAHLSRLEDYAAPAPKSGWHIDHQLGRAHETKLWRCYASSWWLAGQAADSSDVCCRALRQRWWHPRRYALFLPFVSLSSMPAEDEQLLIGADDDRLAEVLPHDFLLLAWLLEQAQLALDHGCLPAWCSPRLAAERIAALWPAGVLFEISGATLDYPFNGLFPHDLVAVMKDEAQSNSTPTKPNQQPTVPHCI